MPTVESEPPARARSRERRLNLSMTARASGCRIPIEGPNIVALSPPNTRPLSRRNERVYRIEILPTAPRQSMRFTPFTDEDVQCTSQCPLWVKSRHVRRKTACLLYPESGYEQCNCRCLLWAKKSEHPSRGDEHLLFLIGCTTRRLPVADRISSAEERWGFKSANQSEAANGRPQRAGELRQVQDRR